MNRPARSYHYTGVGVLIERVPPQDIEAEAAVLGCCLLDSYAASEVGQQLRESDFYRGAHRLIFRHVQDIAVGGDVPDTVLLRDRLQGEGQLEEVGGLAYLMSLQDAVPSAANMDNYIMLVRKCADRRALISAGTTLIEKAEESGCNAIKVRAEHEQALRRIDHRDGSWLSTETVLSHVKDEDMFRTGLTDIDSNTGGIICGLNIFAGNAGAGKSTLGLQVIQRALLAKKKACILGSDQKLSGQAEIMWSAYTKRPIPDLTHGDDWSDAYRDVTGWPLRWYKGRFDINAILSGMRLQAAKGTKWFLVDYLGLIHVPGNAAKHEKKESAAEAIKRLAHELQLYVILISRGTKLAYGERPALRHVEGGAGVANAADQIWWLEPDQEDMSKVEVFIFKSRQAPKGRLFLRFKGATHHFSDWDSTMDWIKEE